MDKREKIKEAMLYQLTKTFPKDRLDVMVESFTDAAMNAIADAEPEPRRSLLDVDEKTPDDALCYCGPSHEIIKAKKWLSYPELAERYVGFNMLPNPGYQPCDGLVLLLFGDKGIAIDHAEAYDWTAGYQAGITEFCPVRWDGPHLVADPERLR